MCVWAAADIEFFPLGVAALWLLSRSVCGPRPAAPPRPSKRGRAKCQKTPLFVLHIFKHIYKKKKKNLP
jgi:hypothetical protein